MTNKDAIFSLAEEIGTIDILFNCAGYQSQIFTVKSTKKLPPDFGENLVKLKRLIPVSPRAVWTLLSICFCLQFTL